MRLKKLTMLLALLFVPTNAVAEASQEQVDTAKTIFLGGPSTENDDYAGQYMQHLLVDLEGKWLQATFFPVEKFAEACERRTIEITVDSPFTFQIKQGIGGPRQLTVSYFNQSGSQFVGVSDPLESAEFFGFDPSNEREFARLQQMMPTLNQQAHVFRPSPDVLVVQAEGVKPEIYARCPAE